MPLFAPSKLNVLNGRAARWEIRPGAGTPNLGNPNHTSARKSLDPWGWFQHEQTWISDTWKNLKPNKHPSSWWLSGKMLAKNHRKKQIQENAAVQTFSSLSLRTQEVKWPRVENMLVSTTWYNIFEEKKEADVSHQHQLWFTDWWLVLTFENCKWSNVISSHFEVFENHNRF